MNNCHLKYKGIGVPLSQSAIVFFVIFFFRVVCFYCRQEAQCGRALLYLSSSLNLIETSRYCTLNSNWTKHFDKIISQQLILESRADSTVKMAAVKLQFSSALSKSDPNVNAVVIIGLPKNLAKVGYNDVKVKFGERVSEEVLHPSLKHLKPFLLYFLN